MVERGKIIAFMIAFMIGTSIFTLMRAEISPASDLHVRLAGIDTDLGITTKEESGDLAERTSWTQTQIWVDPDKKGEEKFTVQILSTSQDAYLDRKYCKQPDIIVTLTEPVPIVHPDVEQVTFGGQTYELHKTTWEIMIKTKADLYSATDVYGEVAFSLQDLSGITGIRVSPAIGATWEGNAYVEYEVTNIMGAFIYEIYVNKDPRVGVISGDGINQNLQLFAGAIPAEAAASYEAMDAVAFYDKIDGQQIIDFKSVLTNHGVMALGGQLGVGADPIIEGHTWPISDKFKGWNLYDVAIQYQIATIIGIPVAVDKDGNSTGDAIDPATGELTGEKASDISGSQREDEQGDPQYYRTDVEDTEGFLEDFFNKIGNPLGGVTDTIKLIIYAIVAIVLILVFFRILLWFLPKGGGRS